MILDKRQVVTDEINTAPVIPFSGYVNEPKVYYRYYRDVGKEENMETSISGFRYSLWRESGSTLP